MQGSLEAHDQRLNERINDRAQEQALQAQTGKKSNWKKGSKGKSHKGKSSSSQQDHEDKRKDSDGKAKKFDRKKIQCYNCQKWGHFAKECKGKKVKRNTDDEAHLAKDDSDQPPIMMMAT